MFKLHFQAVAMAAILDRNDFFANFDLQVALIFPTKF